jgi:hypothetical protein
MKRTLLLTLACVSASLTASAESAETLFYVGEAISTKGANVERHPYILERTTDPDAGTISEKVVSFQRNAYAEHSSVMKITQNQFTMTDSTGTASGEGTLTGSPWNWTFLRAEFQVPKYSMRIVDYNFLADPNSIAGHKDFYMTTTQTESLFLQEDVILHVVDKATYHAKQKELLGL